jgi:2-polyprenyl-3-methyl-5-hydroxy-6-metoxy-1,4-benzoquinol methylase
MATSWQVAAKWYHRTVGEEGLYFHQQIIMLDVKKFVYDLKLKSVFDMGCGQGKLGRQLPEEVNYQGIDTSAKLIAEAKML